MFILQSDVIEKYGIGVRVLGDLSLLPVAVQKSIAKAVYKTRHNNKYDLLYACSLTRTV